MGLAAVYGTVKNHRGTIAVTSEVGRGTQIRIRLPRVAPESSDSAGTTPPSLGPLVPLNVMVVDDEESLRELTVRLLRRLGCEVTAFENGFQAIEHYSRAPSSVDAVILDLVMPILDGRSTYRALRRINPHVKVILTSGYSPDGAAGFVRKPFTLEAIAEAVSRVATPQHSLAPVHNAPATEAR